MGQRYDINLTLTGISVSFENTENITVIGVMLNLTVKVMLEVSF